MAAARSLSRRRHISSFVALLAASSLLIFSAPRFAAAQEADVAEAAPQVENAKFQYRGEINANGVLIRSGASNNLYPTMKLDRGDTVTVVGIKNDWLKIVPPEGSFSYVPKVFVTRRGDGTVGRVNNALNVRAGSSLNQIKTSIQTKLEEGQDVTILGEQDEYFKIAPPEGAYVYVNKMYVKPLEQIVDKKAAQPKEQVATGTAKPPAEPAGPEAEGPKPEGPEPIAQGDPETDVSPDTQPAGPGGNGQRVADAGPTSRPSALELAADYRKLEADFVAASKLPVTEQPIEKLTEGYTALSNSGTLSGTSKQIVAARLKALTMRAEARDQLKAFAQSKQEHDRKQQDLVAEAGEIRDRLKETQVSIYAAVGVLRVSSIQRGNTTLYRLTDPATGRTVVYIASNDAKYAGLLNQFVGVKGDLTTDERLRMKIVTPTDAEAVDASKVNATVIATITPPSMLPTQTTETDLREAGN